jgi:sigma-B regulation protein RsbU (phosphoserine phosphatase)
LLKAGYQLTETGRAEEALRLLSENRYHLVVSDLHLGTLTGLDILEAAKRSNRHTQVLIFTGQGSIRTAVEAMKNGAHEYLTKPIQSDTFLHKVKKALERRDLGRLLEEQQTRLDQYHRMLSRDLALAKRIQSTLVPDFFKDRHVQVACGYQPMIGLGGDFADIYSDKEGKLYLSLIDVTGHGISAALLVNRICSEVRSMVREHYDPQTLLERLNRFFCDSFAETGLYLTLFSLCIDTRSQQITYAASAHPAALLWRKRDRRVVQLESQNMIVGFDKETPTFTQDTVSYAPGDRLLLYTDGIIEVENEQRQPFGVKGLTDCFINSIESPLQDQIDLFLDTSKQYSGGNPRDDVMLLEVEFL